MGVRKGLSKDEEIKLLYDFGLHIPTRKIIVESVYADPDHGESGVDAHMWSRLEKGLTILEHMPPIAEQDDSITIVMNNPGGDEYHMFAMYDRIRASPRRIVIEASGYVMSAASVIFQAADLRRMHRHATMMIHHGTQHMMGHTKDVQRFAKETERVERLLYAIYLGRIREKNPKYAESTFKDNMKFDWWMPATEVVELGLADEIIPYPPT